MAGRGVVELKNMEEWGEGRESCDDLCTLWTAGRTENEDMCECECVYMCELFAIFSIHTFIFLVFF